MGLVVSYLESCTHLSNKFQWQAALLKTACLIKELKALRYGIDNLLSGSWVKLTIDPSSSKGAAKASSRKRQSKVSANVDTVDSDDKQADATFYPAEEQSKLL